MQHKEKKSLRPLAVIVSESSVVACYEPKKKDGLESERKLLSINISMNKLSELLYNGSYDQDTIFDCPALLLITKSNYHTRVNIDTSKTRIVLGKSESKFIPINNFKTKKHGKKRNLLEQSRFVFFVADDFTISKGELHFIPELKT